MKGERTAFLGYDRYDTEFKKSIIPEMDVIN